MTVNPIAHVLTTMGVWTSRPFSFLIVTAYALLWVTFSRDTFDWHGVATIATWMMTLLIQATEHRDTQAIQAKLDELLHTQSGARDELTKIDEKDAEEIEQHRDQARAND
jgi:low affinity Fe/Cu permease